MSDPAAVLDLEPEDLDGHTIDELSDYLDSDRRPADPSIDNSPSCQIALGALQRLRTVTATFLDDDGEVATGTDQDWISTVLAVLPMEVRRGRLFPLPVAEPSMDAHITEGALRGLIRATGDTVPGLLVGAVRIDVLESGAEAALTIEIALVYGTVLAEAEDALRRALRIALAPHAPFAVRRIDVHAVDVILPRQKREGRAP